MRYRGIVRQGVVVLQDGPTLPDGTEVAVSLPQQPATPPDDHTSGPSTLGRKLLELATWAEAQPCDLPEDLAKNHDHYLHGLPKRE